MVDILKGLAVGIPLTIALTIITFVIGSLLGMVLCMLRVSNSRILSGLVGLIVVCLRSIPPILLIFIVFFGIGSGYIAINAFWAAVCGLSLITAANMSEIYRGSLRAIHAGQFEAANALGLPVLSQYRDIIGPQLLRVSLPASATYAIGLLKDTAIASTIGVTEITFNASFISQHTFRGLEVFSMAGALYILISLPIAGLARLADKRLRSRIAL